MQKKSRNKFIKIAQTLVSTEILQQGYERNHPSEFSKCNIKRSIEGNIKN